MNEESGAEKLPSEAKDFGPFFHGTKADLQPGDLLAPGYSSNFGERIRANYIYLTATLDAATWGAELGLGLGATRPEVLKDMRDHLPGTGCVGAPEGALGYY